MATDLQRLRVPADEVFNLKTREGWAVYHLTSIPFEGFTDVYQRNEVRRLMIETGLPVDNVHKVSYLPNTGDDDLRLGHSDRNIGEVALYKRLGKLPPVAHLDTVTHELAHTVTPFSVDNSRFYRDRKDRERAISDIKALASQSLETKVYLNGYHAVLAKSLREGKIDSGRFLEETYAIMIGLRFSNPNHLDQVEDAQKRRLAYLQEQEAKMNEANKLYGLKEQETYKNFKIRGIRNTAEDILLNLMPQMNGSVTDLDRHIAKVRFDSRFGVL